MVDLFGFSGIDASNNPENWPGNPEVNSLVFKNGIYAPDIRQATCGDGLIILGTEERHRRTRKNLKDYLENPPEIEGLKFL